MAGLRRLLLLHMVRHKIIVRRNIQPPITQIKLLCHYKIANIPTWLIRKFSQIHQGESGSSPSASFQTNFTTSQDGGPSSSSSVNKLPPIPPPQSSHSQSTTKPRLPKLVVPKFNGEITKFKSFWDSFDSAVNKNSDLSSVDKLNYLYALLEGQAARAI